MTVTPNDGAEQLQLKGMVLAALLIVMVALAGQSISGMITVIVADWPGGRELLDGLMFIPLTPLLVAFQDQPTWLLALAVMVTGQSHPEPAV